MSGLQYRPTVLSPDAFEKRLQKRWGLDLGFQIQEGQLFDRFTGRRQRFITPTLSNEALDEKLKFIPQDEQLKIVQKMGRISTLETVRGDVESIFARQDARRGQSTHDAVFRYAKAQGRTAVDLNIHFADFSVGKNITTHPLQFASQQEEVLLTEYAQKYERYLRLTKGTNVSEAELAKRGLQRNPKILAEISQLVRDLNGLERQIDRLPLFNEVTPSALEEARFKLDPIERDLNAMADEVTAFRKAAVRHYPELLDTNNNLFQNSHYERSAWLALDNDRNKLLKPREASIISQEKTLRAFRANLSTIDDIILRLSPEAAAQLSQIREGLALSAISYGDASHINGNHPNATMFLNASEYVAALRQLQNSLKPGGAEFWQIDRLLSRAQIGGFEFVAGEARQNCLDIDLLAEALYRQQMKPSSLPFSELSLLRKIAFLHGHLSSAADLDLRQIDISHLDDDAQKNVRKLTDWIFEYRTIRQKYGPKMLERVILAENSSPWQVLAMRLFMEKTGVATSGPGGVEVRPLIETAFDHATMRQLKGYVDNPRYKAIIDMIFPYGLTFMQATSDTSRKEGLLYAYHSVVSFGMKLLEIFPKAWLYFGTGSNTQRFGKMFSFEQITNIPNYYVRDAQERIVRVINVLRGRLTTQGDQFMREARTYGFARSNGGLFLSNFFARTLGAGNDPNPHLNIFVRQLAQSAHKYYQSYVSQSGTYNRALNELTHIRFESALNKGSRSGTGPLFQLSKITKMFTHGAQRAISLSAATEIAGAPGTLIGHGHAIEDWIGNNPNGYDILHERYRNNIHFRKFVRTMLKGMPTANTSIMEMVHADYINDIKSAERLPTYVNFVHRDFELMKAHLPKIIEGTQSDKMWFEFLKRERPSFIRLGRIITTNAFAAAKRIPVEEILLKKVGKSFQRTRNGKMVSLVLNGMASFMRVIRTSG